MTTLLWILHGLLGLTFIMAGTMKLMKARTDLIPMGMGWAEDYTDGQVKAIGGIELLGGLGVILPVALGIATIVSGLAALGLAIVMGAAAMTHLKRKEAPFVAVNAVLGALGLYVAYLHFL